MCEIDLEPCEVWVLTQHTARKEHRCICCEAVIPPGARYFRLFTIFEGDAGTAKHCPRCDRDIRAFAKAHGSGRPHPHGFDAILDECIAEGTPGEARRWRATLARIRARRPTRPTLALTAAPPTTGSSV